MNGVSACLRPFVVNNVEKLAALQEGMISKQCCINVDGT